MVPDKAARVRNFHRSTLHALQELVQAAGLKHPSEVNAHHIVRRLTDTEVRLLSNLILQVEPGALLGDMTDQHNVFRMYWPMASAHSFQASRPAVSASGPPLHAGGAGGMSAASRATRA